MENQVCEIPAITAAYTTSESGALRPGQKAAGPAASCLQGEFKSAVQGCYTLHMRLALMSAIASRPISRPGLVGKAVKPAMEAGGRSFCFSN
ncbi:hypothetical protein [Sporomusa termitida]|uniref:hypothetical protein n=1 Tax=Sporomusa termitida TaxID=2377 RepID=UPI001186F78F|nr:hypothetical protein [Sporomusa termitida]